MADPQKFLHNYNLRNRPVQIVYSVCFDVFAIFDICWNIENFLLYYVFM